MILKKNIFIFILICVFLKKCKQTMGNGNEPANNLPGCAHEQRRTPVPTQVLFVWLAWASQMCAAQSAVQVQVQVPIELNFDFELGLGLWLHSPLIWD